MPYNHRTVEPKWQKAWADAKIFKSPTTPGDKPKFYILDMFPYPSAAGLHVGHPEGYTATDIIARVKRMQGFAVLHPMGWDAFGLPAENYAIQTGVHPHETTQKSIAAFRRQIQSLGFSYDWDREVDTTDPTYYKWTQWLFLQLYKKDLAYEAVVPINFCPSCKTGLANEEVHQGACERCGKTVEKRDMRQWMLKITLYADRLREDLEGLDWPQSTLSMQENWIGRSEGAYVDFAIDGHKETVKVFTTRPDTLFGATFMVLAPEHPLVKNICTTDKNAEVTAYIERARMTPEMERTEAGRKKTGIFTGAYAINPVNQENIPIWIADYVLAHYGTGAIMSVPAHDNRDHGFAKTYDLKIKTVVRPAMGQAPTDTAFEGDGFAIDSGAFTGLATEEFKKQITAWLKEKGLGERAVTYKLRDWVFSRQRYWGEPIPIVHCKGKCAKAVPVPEKDLPITLPQVERFQPTGTGDSPLSAITDWVKTICPECGGAGERETNTMPQWAGSCWYYLRFIDPKNTRAAWDKELEKAWNPVDLYIGGAEHAVLHLLYARFWHKVFYDLGLVTHKEPFKRLRHQGMILAFSHQDSKGAYHGYDEIEFAGETSKLIATGEPLNMKIEKMSKSKKNVVNPDEVISSYGADAMRLYEMFLGDFELTKPWDMRSIEGVSRFLAKVWRLLENQVPGDAKTNQRLRHKTIALVSERIENFKFNTAITALMEFVNALTGSQACKEDLDILLKLLSPFAPHMAEEGWALLGNQGFVSQAAWPTFDPALTTAESVGIAVQINGKLRETLRVPSGEAHNQVYVEAQAKASEKVVKYLENAKVTKVIFVAGRILNYVVHTS
ncbi:MAG: leucine--tRNA ligase [Elusimicrobiota bacterium]